MAQCRRSPDPQIRPLPLRAVRAKRRMERIEAYGIRLVPQGK